MMACADTTKKLAAIHAGGVATLVVIAAAVWLAGVAPMRRADAERAAREAEVADLRLATARKAGVLAALNTELTTLSHELASSKITLKSHDRKNAYLAELTALAEAGGLTVEAVQPQPVVAGDRFDLVPITITARSSYPAALRLLSTLKQRMPDTGVAKFELSADANSQHGGCALRIELTWYTRPSAATGAERLIAEADAR